MSRERDLAAAVARDSRDADRENLRRLLLAAVSVSGARLGSGAARTAELAAEESSRSSSAAKSSLHFASRACSQHQTSLEYLNQLINEKSTLNTGHIVR